MEEKRFKEIMQKAMLDEPSLLFTDNIMHAIAGQEEFAKNDALAGLLQTAVLLKPTEEFTDKIMNRVAPQKQIIFQPIISKKAWRFISAIVAAVFAAIMLAQAFSKKTINPQSKFDGLFALNNKIFVQIGQQSPIIFTCLLSICALLIIDSFARKRAKLFSQVSQH